MAKRGSAHPWQKVLANDDAHRGEAEGWFLHKGCLSGDIGGEESGAGYSKGPGA